MKSEAQYVNEPWQVGISAFSGITGPTCDSTLGATVSEQCDYEQYFKELDQWNSAGAIGPVPEKKIRHPSILITQGMRVIAIIPTGAGDGEKNAKLIVKAPQLLKALKQMVREVEYLIEDGTLPEGAHRHESMVEARKVIDEIELSSLNCSVQEPVIEKED